MSRHNRDRGRDFDRDRGRENRDNRETMDRDYGRHVGDEIRYEYERQAGRNVRSDAGRDYGRQHRTSDRMNDQMNYGRSQGREYDTRYNEDWDRYGMQSDDWRHVDNYWQNTYGGNYPRDSEQWNPNRGREGSQGQGQSRWRGVEENHPREGQQWNQQWNQNRGRDWGHGQPEWRGNDETFGNSQWQAGSHAGRGPRNYKRSDDRIMDDVNEQLTRHHMIDATDIEVTVTDGEVVLRGTVDRRETKRMAEDVAEGVTGVKNVRNEIRVQNQDQQRRDNKDNKGGRAA